MSTVTERIAICDTCGDEEKLLPRKLRPDGWRRHPGTIDCPAGFSMYTHHCEHCTSKCKEETE